MQKGDQIDLFLKLQEIHDQHTSIGSTPNSDFMVRTAMNAVSEEWKTFVQGILGRAILRGWEEMWATLRQEEIMPLTKVRSSGKGS